MSYEFISSTLIIYYVDYCSNDVSISNIFTYWFTRKHIISYVYVYNVYIYTPNHTCIMYAKGVRPRYCYSWLCFSTLPICSHSWSVHLAPPKLLPENRDFGNTLLEGAQALHPRKLHSQNVTEMAYAQSRSVPLRQFSTPTTNTWMSQEVSKRLGSVDYNPNTPHLEVGYKPIYMLTIDPNFLEHPSTPLTHQALQCAYQDVGLDLASEIPALEGSRSMGWRPSPLYLHGTVDLQEHKPFLLKWFLFYQGHVNFGEGYMKLSVGKSYDNYVSNEMISNIQWNYPKRKRNYKETETKNHDEHSTTVVLSQNSHAHKNPPICLPNIPSHVILGGWLKTKVLQTLDKNTPHNQ